METETYRGYLIESGPSPSKGAYGAHWFNVSRNGRKEFEVEIRVSHRHAATYSDSVDAAKPLAANYGRQWVHGKIDDGRYAPGERYLVSYVADSKIPKVTTSHS